MNRMSRIPLRLPVDPIRTFGRVLRITRNLLWLVRPARLPAQDDLMDHPPPGSVRTVSVLYGRSKQHMCHRPFRG
jgi:hypothetical protein